MRIILTLLITCLVAIDPVRPRRSARRGELTPVLLYLISSMDEIIVPTMPYSMASSALIQ